MTPETALALLEAQRPDDSSWPTSEARFFLGVEEGLRLALGLPIGRRLEEKLSELQESAADPHTPMESAVRRIFPDVRTLTPGSSEAIGAGCRCPASSVSSDCPLHWEQHTKEPQPFLRG